MKKSLTLLVILMLSSVAFGQHYLFDAVKQNGGTGSDYTYDVCADAAGNKYITGKYNAKIDFGNGVSITPVNNYDIFVAKYNANNEIQWAQSFGGYSADEGRTVMVDASGNVIITASFFQTVILGSDTLTSHGNFDVVIAKFDANGNYLWMKQAYSTHQDKILDSKIDADGNYTFIGYYGDNALDSLTYEGINIYSNGEREVFVLKTDSDGNPIWGVTAGGEANDYPSALTIDKNNNIYITGYYISTEMKFGSFNITSIGGYDTFIAKLNSAGEYQWVYSANGPKDVEANSIEYVDRGTSEPGNILISGYFVDSIYVSPSSTLHESNGGADVFVLAYTDAGDYDGDFFYGGADYDEAMSINSIKDAGGYYYVSGITKSNLEVNGDTLLNYGGRDMFVMKVYQDSLIWAKNYGGVADDYITTAHINDDGTVYFGGYFKSSPATFNPFVNTPLGIDLWLGQMKAHTIVYLECNLAVQIANGTFNPYEDAVYVRGDFQVDAKDPNGNWQGNMFQLLDEDQNQIYSIMINMPTDTSKIYNYLYAINNELELVDNRNFAVNASDIWVDQMFFNSDAIPSVPIIYSISDIPNDQGGKVRISFSTSTSNTSYSVWRKMDNNGWDAVGSFNAIQDSNYHFVSPTLGDSTINGIVWSTFRISAHTSDPKVFFMSPADSGYSIDNLAPVVPTGVIANGFDEKVELAWDKNVENDFQYYAIYRSTDAEFTTDTMIVATYTTTENLFNDSDVIQGVTYYYMVVAVDYAGNNSEVSQKAFALVTDVETDVEIPTVYELGQNYPNPFNPSTVIKFSIPNSGLVTLKVFNTLGQEVVTLLNEIKPVGIYEISFDASNLTTGMYIYRIESGDFTATKKMMLIK